MKLCLYFLLSALHNHLTQRNVRHTQTHTNGWSQLHCTTLWLSLCLSLPLSLSCSLCHIHTLTHVTTSAPTFTDEFNSAHPHKAQVIHTDVHVSAQTHKSASVFRSNKFGWPEIDQQDLRAGGHYGTEECRHGQPTAGSVFTTTPLVFAAQLW